MPQQSVPRVSVIVPVYNSMPYLTATIESLFAQDLAEEELEVIAIDDGSTDGSGEELDRFAAGDARLRVIHQPNSGWPGMPRNRGLELAGGDYVFFMDSDDTAAPDALRLMLKAAARSGAEVVLPRMRGVGGRRVQPLFDKHPSGPITVSRAMETVSPQKLISRDLIERHGLRFPEGKVRLEDGMLMSRAYLLANRLEFCGSKPLYFIAAREDGGNISAGTIDPAGYVASVRTICENLRAGAADDATADMLVYEFFSRKGMKFYSPKWWRKMSPEGRVEWVRGHRELLRELLPERFDAAIPRPDEAQLLALLRAGDVDAVDAFVSARAALVHRSRLQDARARRGWWRRGGLELSIVTEDADPRPLSLHLLGRVSATRVVIAARSDEPDETGARIHRFTVPDELLAGFGGEILDLSTSRTSADGVSGVPVRVLAEKLPKRIGESGLYRTKTGYASLRTEGR